MGNGPERVVSLCPSLTETIFALGAGERVVGVTDWCVRPAEGVEGIAKVGGTKTPRLERLFELRPDLVFVNEEENRLADVEAIEERGIEIFNTFPKTALEAAAMVRAIGERLGTGERAEAIAGDIEAAAREVRARSAGKLRVPIVCLVWRGPYIAVNRETYIHDLLAAGAGENLFAGRAERYPRIESEELRDAKASAVLLTSEPYPFKPIHAAEVRALCGLGPGRAPLVDGELLSWYGPRTAEGLRYAAELLDRLRESPAS